MNYSKWSALDIVHSVLTNLVEPGSLCIDATAGNGYDTVFLAELTGNSGHVISMDIQEEAVKATEQKIKELGYSDFCDTYCMSHSDIDKIAGRETADAIMFNFGWLPGGDHNIFTRSETSIPAIEKSLDILKPGGVLSLCIYYGRNNGYEERDSIIKFISELDSRHFAVMKCDFLNRKNDPPFPVFVVKEKD